MHEVDAHHVFRELHLAPSTEIIVCIHSEVVRIAVLRPSLIVHEVLEALSEDDPFQSGYSFADSKMMPCLTASDSPSNFSSNSSSSNSLFCGIVGRVVKMVTRYSHIFVEGNCF
jgi:hypothetical protein